MIDMKVQSTSPEMDKWREKVAQEREPFDFIQIDFLVDMREAQKRFKEDYRNDVGGLKTKGLSFNQWLDMKKHQALELEIKYNDFNIK